VSHSGIERALSDLGLGEAERRTLEHSTIEQHLEREIAGRLTVAESHFFRHREHLPLIVQHVGVLLSRGESVAIWSAGCARGEEPFSLAIKLIEALGRPALSKVSILGTDVDGEAVAIGERGVYTAWSLRAVPDRARERWFIARDGGFELKPEVRELVRLRWGSIQEQLEQLPPNSLDVVLFRNVGIYFAPEAVQAIHHKFRRCLRASGVLLQAPADPVPSMSEFRPLIRVSGAYQPAMLEDSAGMVATNEVAEEQAAPRVRREDVVTIPEDSVNPPSSKAFVERSRAFLASDRTDEAIQDLRSALYLSPSDCLARYWYCVALIGSGARERAQQQLRQLARQLSDLGDDVVLSDRETKVGELRRALLELEEGLI
jgi:chemotaxis protein methyltransferase CheR